MFASYPLKKDYSGCVRAVWSVAELIMIAKTRREKAK